MTTPAESANGMDRQLELFSKWSSLVHGFVKSFVLKAVVELRIPDILAKAGGQLTLSEIAAKLPSKTVQLDYLARIMTYASLNDVFTEILDPSAAVTEQGQRRFGLTPLSSMLLEEIPDPKMSLVYMTRATLSTNMMEPWMTFSTAVLSGTEPIQLAHGKSMWELAGADPEFGRMVNNGMAAGSFHIMALVMKVYKGFKGVKTLVDVGGGVGEAVTTITQAYPDIQGINFDLPHVIAEAPEIPGVKNVSGDMFKAVPEGDAIFMKYILHDWTDEQCIQILKNCHKALPQHGKVILVELIVPEPLTNPADYDMDLVMLSCTSGKERNAREWHGILKAAGFVQMDVIPTPKTGISEGYKS